MYVGVTNDLVRRLYEHKNKLVSGFTKKYNVSKLVYFEETKDVHSALAREGNQEMAPGEEGCFSGRRESGVEGAFGSGEGFLPAVEMTKAHISTSS